MIAHDAFVAAQEQQEQARAQAEPRPGEITDPVMRDAMERAKQLHFETFGVRV